jgi:arsenate reductase
LDTSKGIAAFRNRDQHEGRSKRPDEFRDVDFDLVVTVCDSAAEECPIWLGKGRKLHHSFPDPAKMEGNDEEIMAAFRAVRDAIEKEIPATGKLKNW